ncbi:MAG: hypothetical protein ACJAXL_000430 [Alphaproteobacteria bacterium]|jgi:uncharacterized protein (PEP-CTERM system associated)
MISQLLGLKLSVIAVTMSLNAAYAQDVMSSNSGFLSSPSSNNADILGNDSTQDAQSTPSVYSNNKLRKKSRRFKISPYAGLSATYSDNIGLVSDNSPNKEDGMVYNASVGVNASYESQKLDAVAGVGLMQIVRSNDTNDTVPTGSAGVSTELVNNLLYLDALGSVTGLVGNARGANVPSGASSADYDIFLQGTISPYLRHQFGNILVGELRYGYDYGGGTADTIGTIQSHTYRASFGTSDNAGRLNINGSTSYSDISFQNEDVNTSSNLTGNNALLANNDSTQLTNEVSADYVLTKSLTLLGQAGHDKIEMEDSEYADQLSGVFYNVGLQYMPSERLRLTGRIGERNDTLYYLVDGNYNLTKRVFVGATAVSQLMTAIPLGFRGNIAPGTAFDAAVEGQTLASQLNDQLPGSTQNNGQNNGQNLLGNQQNRELFRSQALTAYLGMQSKNGDFGVALGYENRNYNRATDEIIKTATVHYRHNFNRQISGTVEGYYSDLDGLAENTNQTYGARLLGNYALNDSVNLFAAIGRNERKTEFSQDFEFTEHNVTAGISTQF